MLRDLQRAKVLIVDELGYVPFDREGAQLLSQGMGDCYERRTLVVTMNIEFSKWGVVFGDEKMAAALIDRIVHHGRLVEHSGAEQEAGGGAHAREAALKGRRGSAADPIGSRRPQSSPGSLPNTLRAARRFQA